MKIQHTNIPQVVLNLAIERGYDTAALCDFEYRGCKVYCAQYAEKRGFEGWPTLIVMKLDGTAEVAICDKACEIMGL